MWVVLRNASAYSCILSKPVRITNVRGKRHTPGLKQQHLSGLQLLTEITQGQLEGGFVKSTEISLTPGTAAVTQTDFTSDQHGAG
jgi:RNA 3'-terminal phosphate cyclase (ATP)